jgi:predicted kinase
VNVNQDERGYKVELKDTKLTEQERDFYLSIAEVDGADRAGVYLAAVVCKHVTETVAEALKEAFDDVLSQVSAGVSVLNEIIKDFE